MFGILWSFFPLFCSFSFLNSNQQLNNNEIWRSFALWFLFFLFFLLCQTVEGFQEKGKTVKNFFYLRRRKRRNLFEFFLIFMNFKLAILRTIEGSCVKTHQLTFKNETERNFFVIFILKYFEFLSISLILLTNQTLVNISSQIILKCTQLKWFSFNKCIFSLFISFQHDMRLKWHFFTTLGLLALQRVAQTANQLDRSEGNYGNFILNYKLLQLCRKKSFHVWGGKTFSPQLMANFPRQNDSLTKII